MAYSEDEFLALSGIQHFVFCRRQWALIHLEQAWAENVLTAQGLIMHDRAHDDSIRERREDAVIVRGLSVHSWELGISGQCDVVEFRRSAKGHPLSGEEGLWLPFPVEYKHGKAKIGDEDRMQLCAQALCLEEMFACDIPQGSLYYGRTRSRERVSFDENIRSAVRGVVGDMHKLYKRGETPQVRRFRGCASCSLKDLCIPKIMSEHSRNDVERYVSLRLFEGDS